ncbi:YkvA family protein [Aeoliella sp. ICT_H6.2]|uniref:YkvA family protein n=1 Tax=Aeoliella straminimaris TaxID=2954799 RepID=A0A9X2JHA2_9BACT|nr:YkvA family protein [Aeoliella straminimaris]MCO6045581.1 YkvA family protein [Aeoliella straminimaris]
MLPFFSREEQESRKQEAQRLYKESIEHLGEDELSTAASLGEQKYRRLEDDVPNTLAAIWRELQLLLAMLRHYVQGSYRQIPFGTIAAVGAAVLYFASPVDAIPDFIPGLGYIDDAAVVMTCLQLVRGDLETYRQWLKLNVEAA